MGCGRRKFARGAWDYTGAAWEPTLQVRNSVGASVIIHIHTRSESEISFHMKCEGKVKVKPIRCFHVKSRTLSAGARRGHGRGQKSFWGVDYYKPVTVPSSLVPWPALGRSAPRGGAVKRPYGFSLVDFGQKAQCAAQQAFQTANGTACAASNYCNHGRRRWRVRGG